MKTVLFGIALASLAAVASGKAAWHRELVFARGLTGGNSPSPTPSADPSPSMAATPTSTPFSASRTATMTPVPSVSLGASPSPSNLPVAVVRAALRLSGVNINQLADTPSAVRQLRSALRQFLTRDQVAYTIRRVLVIALTDPVTKMMLNIGENHPINQDSRLLTTAGLRELQGGVSNNVVVTFGVEVPPITTDGDEFGAGGTKDVQKAVAESVATDLSDGLSGGDALAYWLPAVANLETEFGTTISSSIEGTIGVEISGNDGRNEAEDDGYPAGAIVGIVLGVCAGAAIIVALLIVSGAFNSSAQTTAPQEWGQNTAAPAQQVISADATLPAVAAPDSAAAPKVDATLPPAAAEAKEAGTTV